MFEMKAEINEQDIRNLLQTFSGELVRKAIRSSVDKTATWAKNYLGDLVAQNYNVEASEARKTMVVVRSTQTNLSASVKTTGRGLSLIKYFNSIQDASGVTSTIKSDWIKRTPHAFINTVSGKSEFKLRRYRGHWRMGVKKGRSTDVIMMRVGRNRYPTTGKAGWGPPVPALLGRSKVLNPAKDKMKDHLYSELANQINKRTMGMPQIAGIE